MEKAPRKKNSSERLQIKTFNEFKISIKEIGDFIGPHLSEPYTIFTFYFFLTHYPELCTFLVDKQNQMKGVLIGRTEEIIKKSEQRNPEELSPGETMIRNKKAYIAMIVIDPEYRRRGYARQMIQKFIDDVRI